MTTQQARRDTDRHIPPIRRPRLRLMSKGPETGYVDGAWWPRGDDLAAELPDLFPILSKRLGPIHRVRYHIGEWADAPAKFTTGHRQVRLDGYRHQPAHTLSVHGINRSCLVLLIVPPFTSAEHAYTLMMTAAGPDNASTIENLLTISHPMKPEGTENPAAEHQWDSEGGLIATPADPTLIQPIFETTNPDAVRK